MTTEDLRREARKLTATDVLGEVLALSIVEFTMAPGVSISIELTSSGATVSDTGRGISLPPDAGDTLSHAERAFTSFYPCLPSLPDVDMVLHELIWGARGPLGPALPNFACPVLQFTSRRDGEAWSQTFHYGKAAGPASMVDYVGTTGSTVCFETETPIDHALVARLIQNVSARIPRLDIALVVRPAT